MTDTSKKQDLLASVVKAFRPDPQQPSAPPPSCCGECGGDARKNTSDHPEKKS